MDVPKNSPWLLLTVTASRLHNCHFSTTSATIGRTCYASVVSEREYSFPLYLWSNRRREAQAPRHRQLRQVLQVIPTALSLHWVPMLPGGGCLRRGSRTKNTLYHKPHSLPALGRIPCPMMKVNPLLGVPHPRTSTVFSSSGTSDMRIPAVGRIQACSPVSPPGPPCQ